MESVEELLLNTLQDLGSEELKKFQWYLKTQKQMQTSDLENADRLVTVDKMVDRFGKEDAVKIMVEILKKMNKNNQANNLENKHKQAVTPTDMSPTPPPGSTPTNPPAVTPTDMSPTKPPGSTPTNPPVTNIVPSTRDDFLQYYYKFTLDGNTVYKRLRLDNSKRVVSHTDKERLYSDHPDRFDYYPQVLCNERVRDRCYWEVKWSGDDGVYISVTYKSISRKGDGDECAIGHNNKSWSLFCSPSRYSFIHNDKWIDLAVMSGRRIGVYVDQRAGTLSFHNVSDAMSLIHRVQTTFTQPLYPGFYVDYDSSVKLVDRSE